MLAVFFIIIFERNMLIAVKIGIIFIMTLSDNSICFRYNKASLYSLKYTNTIFGIESAIN